MAKNHFIQIRVNPDEKEKLDKIAKMEGYSTLTNFCRARLFQSLSTEMKLNQILGLLNDNKGGRESDNGKSR